MQFGQLFSVATAFIVLAGVAIVVTSPNTRGDIAAIGNTFTNSLKAATLR